VYLSLLDAAGVYASDVRLTLAHPLIERDSTRPTPGGGSEGAEKYPAQDDGSIRGRRGGRALVTRYSDIREIYSRFFARTKISARDIFMHGRSRFPRFSPSLSVSILLGNGIKLNLTEKKRGSLTIANAINKSGLREGRGIGEEREEEREREEKEEKRKRRERALSPLARAVFP